MSVEERLVETLRLVDRFEPSQDLFARVQASIVADRAHRRRVARAIILGAVALAAAATWVGLAVRRAPGTTLVHQWTLEVLEAAVLLGALLLLGPLIRRSGRVFVSDVFRLSPATGERFVRLLDLAYYLAFSGLIIVGVELTDVGRIVALAPGLQLGLERIATFLAAMGLAHALNLAVLPAVGLVFNASRRRVLRRAAGRSAPPVSPRAVAADRVSTWLVASVGIAAAVGAVLLVGFVLGLGAG